MRKLYCLLLAIIMLFVQMAMPVDAQTIVREITFPTDASQVTFNDNFGDARSGHPHAGIDILGPKMTPLYSAIDGKVSYIVDPEPSYGYMIVLEDNDGYTYHYIHVNNDTPGTDDGNGGTEYAYAPGIERGASVSRGQLIGWMGDSGNAENIASHLHFEIRYEGEPINPYQSLVAVLNASRFDPELAKAQSPDINTDKALESSPFGSACLSGTLIKPQSSPAVYYCGADGKRYVFPNDRTYFTWYADFEDVITITDEGMANVQLGGNVTYRPGVKMIKIQSEPNVYAVDVGGVLRWVQTQEIAESLYGKNWAKQVEDVNDAFFFNYTIGEPIISA